MHTLHIYKTTQRHTYTHITQQQCKQITTVASAAHKLASSTKDDSTEPKGESPSAAWPSISDEMLCFYFQSMWSSALCFGRRFAFVRSVGQSDDDDGFHLHIYLKHMQDIDPEKHNRRHLHIDAKKKHIHKFNVTDDSGKKQPI